MSTRQHPDTARAMKLVAKGVPIYAAAARCKIAVSTLYRAIARAAKEAMVDTDQTPPAGE